MAQEHSLDLIDRTEVELEDRFRTCSASGQTREAAEICVILSRYKSGELQDIRAIKMANAIRGLDFDDHR